MHVRIGWAKGFVYGLYIASENKTPNNFEVDQFIKLVYSKPNEFMKKLYRKNFDFL